MEPDLELVGVRDDQSFKIWSHGYPFRTVRWHFHPEYELHLVTATEGDRYVGDHIGHFRAGDLVFVGPNLPHNWISEIPAGETVVERCLILQFTGEFINSCMAIFPELRFMQPLLEEAVRGVRFESSSAERAGNLMRELLEAQDARRIALFISILDVIGHAEQQIPLASIGFQPRPSAYLSTSMNLVLQHIGRNFTRDLNETELARLSRQSVSTFARSFRKHTGMTFVQYVNALRIELACQYLCQNDLTIMAICHEVGFNNVSNFNRQFLAFKGMSPSKFRSMRRDSSRFVSAA
ncbi:AraC family transcriptional regulator [Lichenifustis flavocetrariae]|uniref:AraC family transcriptional regulator n=1 Tax=Lichenifustis flavocetrariae TaxID=2949735 RepID=A0AA41Z202_9HYPH|nr:AraC family transcriptional regulator [Lichenifustis flavocetrariae]MCW6512749.1 AraC family transcriptional regulator [Lichenifustis flavocetrariae]